MKHLRSLWEREHQFTPRSALKSTPGLYRFYARAHHHCQFWECIVERCSANAATRARARKRTHAQARVRMHTHTRTHARTHARIHACMHARTQQNPLTLPPAKLLFDCILCQPIVISYPYPWFGYLLTLLLWLHIYAVSFTHASFQMRY